MLALGAALLYLPALRDAPFYLNRDEMFFGLTAHSLVATGRDTTGRFLPLYFQTQMRYGSEMWFQPILMYAVTASVKVLGLSEGTIRLPMALAGIIDVVLVYFVARLLVAREIPAIAAAVALALTPAHFINSRVALDFQTPLPFILGWLLCLLLYLRRGRPSLLFTAGLLLGVGVYSYIAAYLLMPTYAALTCVVLYQRREPVQRYGVLAAGFILPVLCCLPFLIGHPTVLHDIFWHYERDKPQHTGAVDLLAAFFSYDRFATAASVYWGFWNPRFLFINGPQSMWVAGAFLLPMAGVLVIGVLRALRRPALVAVLLLGGLLTAPIPASLVGDGEAIHRAAAVLPFGVLLAIVGLDSLWTTERSRAERVAFVAVWVVIIGLAAAYHYELPLAQAVIRAATVPLAMAGLYVLARRVPVDRVLKAQCILVAAVSLIAMQFAYVALGYETVAWASALLLAIVAMVVLRNDATADPLIRQLIAVVALSVASSDFMYAYADYSYVHRVRFVPATAILVTVRLIYASGALAAMIGVASFLRGVALDRLSRGRLAAIIAAIVIALQVVYFHIDYFVDSRVRFVQAMVIVAAAVCGAALLAKGATGARPMLGPLTAMALLGLTAIQFTYFSVDYFTRYRARSGNLEPEGNARVAWEAVVERARQRSVPAIELADVGPYGFSDLYWNFYAIKHDREDLLTRTRSDVAFAPDRIRTLPAGSLVVTSPSPRTDASIERMLRAGELRDPALVTAPDGSSKFWILETGARPAVAVR